MKPLLVGEQNPYGADPKFALYPYPENSAGGRLCFKVFGLTRHEYLARFDRVNLCSGKWSMSRAWNEPGAYERARAVLREAGVL